MPSTQVPLRRFSVVSRRPFEQVLTRLTATIGRPDMSLFRSALDAASTISDLENLVQQAVGPSGLMEFARFDAGAVLRKGTRAPAPKVVRLLVGNPLIMKEMVRTVPDAASYAPVTILADERADGVHLSYDSIATLIAPYGSETALLAARGLDSKIEALLETAAQ
jgi:uncharacterized protein (DUF302 family)